VDAARLPAPQLGRILIAAGLLNEEQLAQALEEQARSGRRLGEIIVQRGFISGPALANALAEQHGGVLKTEYGFASGLGGVVARRAASEAGTSVSPLRPPEPTAIPQLRTAEPQTEEPPPESEQEPAMPDQPAVPEEPADQMPRLEPPASPESVQPSQPLSEQPPEPASPPFLRATTPPEPLDPVELRGPPPEPVQDAPQAPEPEPKPEPVAGVPDDRDALLESLRARVEAQDLEIAGLREQLEQERARKDVQVHVWPEKQPPAPPAGPAQAEHYLLCVPTAAGYVLLDRVGGLPSVGEAVEVPEEEGRFTVTKVVRLPRNGRPCAYLQRA